MPPEPLAPKLQRPHPDHSACLFFRIFVFRAFVIRIITKARKSKSRKIAAVTLCVRACDSLCSASLRLCAEPLRGTRVPVTHGDSTGGLFQKFACTTGRLGRSLALSGGWARVPRPFAPLRLLRFSLAGLFSRFPPAEPLRRILCPLNATMFATAVPPVWICGECVAAGRE